MLALGFVPVALRPRETARGDVCILPPEERALVSPKCTITESIPVIKFSPLRSPEDIDRVGGCRPSVIVMKLSGGGGMENTAVRNVYAGPLGESRCGRRTFLHFRLFNYL